MGAAVLATLLAVGVSAHSAPQGTPQSTAASQRDEHHESGKAPASNAGARLSPRAPLHIDRTGRPRIGVASFYARFFAGRRMADGAPMDPHGSNAASRTLPLGTIARVTNLATHRSVLVTIEDRGPYVPGRIVDLSPTTALQIGITARAGIARVRVTPLRIPTAGHERIASLEPAAGSSRRRWE